MVATSWKSRRRDVKTIKVQPITAWNLVILGLNSGLTCCATLSKLCGFSESHLFIS